MDERFIKWLNIYDEFSNGTVLRDILNDAIRCYRHDIARPALMLSYIAFFYISLIAHGGIIDKLILTLSDAVKRTLIVLNYPQITLKSNLNSKYWCSYPTE